MNEIKRALLAIVMGVLAMPIIVAIIILVLDLSGYMEGTYVLLEGLK